MSNSPLVKYKKISPNQYGKRNHVIDTITIHCMAGQITAETCGEIFASSSRQASSNYGIGKDGKIGMYVEESCASWCTSNYANDQRAITIEVASDSSGSYKVTEAAYKSLINLVYDICKRNKIKKLKWSTNKSDRVNHKNGCNMTVHCDYANKCCPGEYLYSHMGDIAKKVNAKLASQGAPQSGATLKIKEDSKLYEHAYKDPVGGASKSISVKKGTKVKFIKDDKTGWSKVKYDGKERWVLNSRVDAKLSSHPKVKLTKDKKCHRVVDNKLSKTETTLKKGTTVTRICLIESGKYKGYSYAGIDKKRYYIKNL